MSVITKDEIKERVKRLLVEQFSAEEIRVDTRIKEDLGYDELDVVEFTMALENEFDIDEIEDEAVDKCQDDPTVSQWVEIVEAALTAKDEQGPRKTVTRK